MEYHRPVLLQACVEGLNIKQDGIYVDATFGGGGHSRSILDKLTAGRLVAFDQDVDAQENSLEDDRFMLVQQNFRYLKNILKMHRLLPVQGILADLGVSSHQFDVPDRGFSIRFDGKLDMRMDQQGPLTAAEMVNTYAEEDLSRIFWLYGEVKNARKLAKVLVAARDKQSIHTISELKKAIDPCVIRAKEKQYLAQVFQALRIEVNDELGALKSFLKQTVDVLEPGGRLVVMSYHSLEDRLVKHFIRSGNFEGKVEQDFYGNVIKPLKAINNKVIVPDEEEINANPRARSAKLRIAEKIA